MRAQAEGLHDTLAEPAPGGAAAMTDLTRKRTERRLRRELREADVIEARQIEHLEKSLAGLEQLGYVAGGGLTEKGYWAANLCTSLVLELGEAIDQHLFEDLDAQSLAGAVAAVAGDPHRPYFSLKPNALKKDFYKNLEEVILHVRQCFAGANPDIKVLPDAALTVMTWYEAQSWPEFSGLLRLAGVAEGDVARLVSQTADHLNQMSRLGETHTELARTAAEARRQLLRPPFTDDTGVEG
jgi:hypothetical protein